MQLKKEDLPKISEEIKRVKKVKNLVIKRYKFNGKRFIHIGHPHFFYNQRMSFQPIFQEIKKFQPERILFEMKNADTQKIEKISPKKREELFGENGIIYNWITRNNHLKNKIKFKGSDPGTLIQLKKLKGFKKEEIDAYKIYSIFPQIFLNNKTSPRKTLEEAGKINKIKITRRIISLIEEHSKKFLKKPLDEIKPGDNLSICPYYDITLSRIAREIRFFREKEIVKNIQRELKKHNKVLALNGINHVIIQENFWKKAYLK